MSDLATRLQSALGDTYRLEKELGGGGMSRVFLAEETGLGRKVVVKVLPPEMAAGVNKERFQREIRLAASLQHPHIVPLLTTGSASGAGEPGPEGGDLLYYVMPYIAGESLRAKLAREGELPIGETVRILREVVDALAYAHVSEVVHRDIKPDNVLLSGDHAVVTDFGVAKAVSASSGGTASSLTSLGVALGTPAYMSPEQAAADPHVDHRADIYAVGALAYEMLTGRPPFTGATPQQVLAAHLSQTPDPITLHRNTIPPDLADLIMRCLAKRAADRWQSAGELKAQLNAMATPQSGGVTPTGTQPVSAVGVRPEKHHPVRVAVLFGVTAAVVLVVVYGLMVGLGLPSWVFAGAVALLAVGLPIVMVTGRRERERAVAATTGLRVATPVGLERHLTWKKAITGGGAAFGGLALVAGAYMMMRVTGIGPFGSLVASGALDAQARIVLADFENTAADSSLGQTVSDLFRIDLNESPTINLLSASQISQVLARMELPLDAPLTPDVASEVAIREGVKAYLTGEIRSLGESYLLSARLVSSETGADLVSVREQADNSTGIVDAVDRMGLTIRERIGESFNSLRADQPLARITTSSLPALQLYGQATRMYSAGSGDQAIALLEQAVAVDSNFAMAWRRLGAYLGNPGVGREEEGRNALRHAYALRDRLPERERYHVEAMYAQRVEPDQQKVVTAYLAILEKYPNDGTALNNLAASYMIRGNLPEAERWYREAIARGAVGRLVFGSAIFAQWNQAKYDAADTTLQLFLEEFPGHPDAMAEKAFMASARGEYQKALAVLDSFLTLHGNEAVREAGIYNHRRVIALVRGKLDEANRWNRERLLVNTEKRDLFPRAERPLREAENAAEVSAWYGVDPPSVHDLDDLWRRIREARLGESAADLPWYDVIRTYARLGAVDRARELLSVYERQLGDDGRERERLALMTLRGRVALAGGRPQEAVQLLRDILIEAPPPARRRLASWLLAEAYRAAGANDSAIVYFEQYLDTPQLSGVFNDAWMLAPSLVALGELYEERDPEKAAEYYNRFVELWRDADPELQPQVEDVRGRIARLVQEPRAESRER